MFREFLASLLEPSGVEIMSWPVQLPALLSKARQGASLWCPGWQKQRESGSSCVNHTHSRTCYCKTKQNKNSSSSQNLLGNKLTFKLTG
jgi:hypothetical protein